MLGSSLVIPLCVVPTCPCLIVYAYELVMPVAPVYGWPRQGSRVNEPARCEMDAVAAYVGLVFAPWVAWAQWQS